MIHAAIIGKTISDITLPALNSNSNVHWTWDWSRSLCIYTMLERLSRHYTSNVSYPWRWVGDWAAITFPVQKSIKHIASRFPRKYNWLFYTINLSVLSAWCSGLLYKNMQNITSLRLLHLGVNVWVQMFTCTCNCTLNMCNKCNSALKRFCFCTKWNLNKK